MPSQVTITAPIGPGSSMAAQVITDVTVVHLDLARKTVEITAGTPSKQIIASIAATTTITDSISGGNHTIVISQ